MNRLKIAIISSLLIFSGLSQSKDMDGEFAVFGVGGNLCTDFLNARKRNSPDYAFYKDWLEGYLSAFNLIATNTYDIMSGRNLDQALSWLGKYCDRHQDIFFINATAELTLKLFPARANMAPNKNTAEKWNESGSLVSDEETQSEPQPARQ